MTQAETTKGRGRPKFFDEHELADRIESIEDLDRVRQALEANGASAWAARGPVMMLAAIKAGDPTGGVSRMSRTRYRAMLAELPPKSLPGPAARSRRRSRNSRGSAHLGLVSVGSGAGALALAAVSHPEALNFALSLAHTISAAQPPIMRRTREAAPTETLAAAA